MTGLTFSAADWPAAMSKLSSKEQVLAIYLARGFTLGEAALAAGYSAGSSHAARNAGHQAASKPPVRAAVTALKAHHAAQHRETLRYA